MSAVSRNRSLSDPSELVSRTPSFVRRSMFRRGDREGSKRKSIRRPHSSIGVRVSPSKDKEKEVGGEGGVTCMKCGIQIKQSSIGS